MTKAPDDFEAVRQLVETLTPFESADRERIIRWAREKLGMAAQGQAATATPIVPATTGAGPTAQPGAGTTELTGRAPDIKTFVDSKRPKSDVQFAAVVAYYYRFEAAQLHRHAAINADMLQEATRHCGRERFKHPAMTLNNAKNQGYLDSPAKGEFAINSVGENLVAMTLPGEAPSSNGKSRKRHMAAKTRNAKKRSAKR